MSRFGMQLMISSPYGNLIFGIAPFNWQFDYCRMITPVHAIILNLGPFTFAVTGDPSYIHSLIKTEDI